MAPVDGDFVVVISKKSFLLFITFIRCDCFFYVKVSKNDSMNLFVTFRVLQSCS